MGFKKLAMVAIGIQYVAIGPGFVGGRIYNGRDGTMLALPDECMRNSHEGGPVLSIVSKTSTAVGSKFMCLVLLEAIFEWHMYMVVDNCT